MSDYKQKYWTFELFFNKNLECNYISIKDRIFHKLRNIWLHVEEETAACSYSADCNFKSFIFLLWYDYFFLSVLGKLSLHCLIETKQFLKYYGKTRPSKFGSSTKVDVIGDGICWNLWKSKRPYLLQSNRHQHAESCRRWSYSDNGPYCDSNRKSGNETYALHLSFKQ